MSTVTSDHETVRVTALRGRLDAFVLRRLRGRSTFFIGLVWVLLVCLVALFAPLIARYPPNQVNFEEGLLESESHALDGH